MKIADRIKAPLPRFFRRLCNVGLVVAFLLSAASSFLDDLCYFGGYHDPGEGIISAGSQLTVKEDKDA